MTNWNDKTVIVTGAASGIGKACAELFADYGANVVLSDLESSAGEEVAARFRDEGAEAMFVGCDVSNPEQIQGLVDSAVETFGALDVAVNNAGVRGDMMPLAEIELEHWQQIIDVNLTGVFTGMKAQIQAMLDSGGGSIVNVASVAGQVGFPDVAAYTASKHGVVGLTRTAALEYSSQGIQINCIGPAVIETPMVEDMTGDEESREQLLGAHPIGRFGTPREVAELIAFLGGDEAGFITGSFIPIDGGYLSK